MLRDDPQDPAVVLAVALALFEAASAIEHTIEEVRETPLEPDGTRYSGRVRCDASHARPRWSSSSMIMRLVGEVAVGAGPDRGVDRVRLAGHGVVGDIHVRRVHGMQGVEVRVRRHQLRAATRFRRARTREAWPSHAAVKPPLPAVRPHGPPR